MESCGREWIILSGGSSFAQAKRSWEGLEEDEGAQAGTWGNGPSSSCGNGTGRCGTVWTAPCSLGGTSYADFKIVTMRGRSIFQIGVTRLVDTRRNQFWGDVEEDRCWSVFMDKYGYCDLRNGHKSPRSLPREEYETDFGPLSDGRESREGNSSETLVEGRTIRVQLDTVKGRVAFFRDGVWVGAMGIPPALLSGGGSSEEESFVFAVQMLGRGDTLQLSGCAGLQCTAWEEDGKPMQGGKPLSHELPAEGGASINSTSDNSSDRQRVAADKCGCEQQPEEAATDNNAAQGGRGKSSPVRCSEGHVCAWSRYKLDGYEHGWVCSTCETLGSGPRFFCSQCLFDVCGGCHDTRLLKQVVEEEEAALARKHHVPKRHRVAPSTSQIHLQTPKWALYHIEGHGAYCPACEHASKFAFPAPDLPDEDEALA